MNSKAAKKLRKTAKEDAKTHEIPVKWLYKQMKSAYKCVKHN